MWSSNTSNLPCGHFYIAAIYAVNILLAHLANENTLLKIIICLHFRLSQTLCIIIICLTECLLLQVSFS